MKWHYTKHDGQAVLHSQKGILEMLEKWWNWWENCVQSQGDYFKGD
jgi:hypothetical protein